MVCTPFVFVFVLRWHLVLFPQKKNTLFLPINLTVLPGNQVKKQYIDCYMALHPQIYAYLDSDRTRDETLTDEGDKRRERANNSEVSTTSLLFGRPHPEGFPELFY